MKRYLYILLGALAMAGCEPQPTPAPEPVVEYHFGTMSAETSANSATITADIPTITIDGVEDKSATFSLGYYEEGLLFSDRTIVEEYTTEGGKAIFAIEGLKPNTQYTALLSLRSATAEERDSEPITFRTAEHTPVAEYSCECIIEPMGVVAYALLDGVSFTLDGVESPLAKVEFKYALASSNGEWTTVMISPEDVEKNFKIPAEGEPYLQENSDYNYSVTLYPEDTAYESYTLNGEFTTTEARLTSDVELPTITATNDAIHLSSKVPTLFVDGEVIPDYGTTVYKFYYTNYNGHEGFIDAVCADGVMSATAALSMFEEGVTYNFRTCMEVNDMILLLSGDAPYTIPVVETPTPPAPPVSGDADTKAIAGEWHLTEWRGTEPSFDVYLSITEDGVVTLWQRIESREWELFISVVGFDNGIISGEYSDGVAWSTSYSVALGDNTMTWIDTTDSTDISVYTRSELPDSLPSTATATTRSTVRERFL